VDAVAAVADAAGVAAPDRLVAVAPDRLVVVLAPAAVMAAGPVVECREAARQVLVVHRRLAHRAVAAPRNCPAAGLGHRSAIDPILVVVPDRELAAGQTSAPVLRNCRREEPAPVERVGGKSRRCHRPVPTSADPASAAGAPAFRICRPSVRVPH
jgi:hypothetical protein